MRSARSDNACTRLKRQRTIKPPMVSTVTSAPKPTRADEDAGMPAASVAAASTVCHASPKTTRALALKIRTSRVAGGLASTAEETLICEFCAPVGFGGRTRERAAGVELSSRGQSAVRLPTGAGDAHAEVDRAPDRERRKRGQPFHAAINDSRGAGVEIGGPPTSQEHRRLDMSHRRFDELATGGRVRGEDCC